MKKILTLLGMLTLSSTTATSVVACNANQDNNAFAFDKEKAVLEDGSLHYYEKTQRQNHLLLMLNTQLFED